MEIILTQYAQIYFKTFLGIKMELSCKLVSTFFPELHRIATYTVYALQPDYVLSIMCIHSVSLLLHQHCFFIV